MAQAADCTIVIVTFLGEEHLKYLLPTVAEVRAATTGDFPHVMVLDNAGSPATEAYLRRNFRDIKYIPAHRNDYLFSVNEIARAVQSRYLFVLNDDMKLSADILLASLPLLEADPSLFAVSCTVLDWEGASVQEAVRTIAIRRGWMQIYSDSVRPSEVRYTFNACGGASIYRTSMFNELGGFDRLYFPAYYEDGDLSHRAWHRGWKIINHPAAVVFHRGGGSWNTSSNSSLRKKLIYRNRVLGMLANCDRRGFLSVFILMLPIRAASFAFMNRVMFSALCGAVPRWGQVMKRRNVVNKRSDEIVMAMLGKKYVAGDHE